MSYWAENHLPSEWTPIGDKGVEYRFVRHSSGAAVWHGYLREWVPRYGTWAGLKVMTVGLGMSEDRIRSKLFEAVYEYEKAFIH